MDASILELRKFVVPEFVFGPGARRLAGRYAKNFGGKKVLLVTDEKLRKETPWVQEVGEALDEAGLAYVTFDQVSSNPRACEVLAGTQLFHDERCNLLVALGGGSVMDCAKGIGILCSNGGSMADYEGVDQVLRPMPPLLCIPTTSGTASEVSQFAIIVDEQRKAKMSIVSKAVVPDVGLVDPEVTMTMDPHITRCTGLDVLSHAVEAYVSNASSPLTDLHAMEAIRLVQEGLPKVLAHPEDLYWRSKMMLASLQAGMAFSNAILGAVHAMSHSLGGYLDLTHGECNAILLGPVMEYNYPACPEKFQAIGHVFGLSLEYLPVPQAGRELCLAMEDFRKRVGLSHSLRNLGVTRELFPQLARYALQDACLATNPRAMEQADLEAVYEKAY